jgi:hypothetical protein
MARFLSHSTFSPGELERELKALALKTGVVTDAPEDWRAKRRHPLHLKSHECAVTFPDDVEGICNYTRQGPRWHLFRYGYGVPNRYGLRENLPIAYLSESLGRDASSIESMAQEKAVEAFRKAILQERQDARRVQPPWTGHLNRKADPKLFTLSRERAIAVAGRYALCIRLQPSGKLLAVSAAFETLEEANAPWREKGDTSLVVAIASRWARRWTIPRFNPLYGESSSP